MPRSIIAPARRINLLPHGIVAGLVAGVAIDLFLFVTGVAKAPGVYQFIASTLVGKAAFAAPAYIWLGLAMHFAISIAWGALYAVLAQRIGTAMLDRPLVSGLTYGLVVWIGMQALLYAAHVWHPPASAAALAISLAAHTLFFGLPIAAYVYAAVRRRRAA